jgi:dTDP-4-dehydrorhamnose 3,5-epimerase|tara:strand:+ start:564 stop:1106 length:543 start_codon:yes stop_codon:yes gene_type:complete
MTFDKTNLNDVLIITPDVFGDDRGYFFEPYNQKIFKENVGDFNFVQDNQSCSSKGVLRGLHFQNPPYEQGKLVRVIRGSVADVIVDLRKESSTYGKYLKVILTDSNFKMLWVPPGFAHGFETLEDNTIFAYKVTNYYNKESEGCIHWNDSTLNISWESKSPIISEKDKVADKFESFNSLF